MSDGPTVGESTAGARMAGARMAGARSDSEAGVGDVRIGRHSAPAAGAFRDQVLALWPEVFGPVADEGDWRDRFWEQHRSRDDFRLVTAVSAGELLGFGWGYTGQRGQWWSDVVAEALGAGDADWVGGHFELVELAVRPAQQGRGLGGALHDALLDDLPHSRTLLQTDADARGAGHRLYRRRGWSVLGDLAPQKVVMGKHLRA
ncbi:GNAT family N-acetyltransferase [Brachybacterium sp. AOP43-C2-M15]|uniref:GNAT family N-acetyltransferase n=1 Tax=Brachybacterium sp. AOP43-C2-M15 TaxID=3457661 RepID=UPI0040333AF1